MEEDYKTDVVLKSEKEEYEKFIKEQENCDFQQCRAWAKLKECWENEIIIIKDNNKNILATMSILIRKIPILGNLMYVPRGPIGNIEDEEILTEITKEMKKIAKKYKAFVVIIEPNIEKSNKNFTQMVQKLGFKVNSNAIKFDQEIQARHNFRLNLENKTEEKIFQNFSSKTRYNIRLATKKGVIIKEKRKDGLDEFYELMEETGRRDDFRIRSREYFERILDEFKQEVKIYIAYYNEKPIATIMPILYGNKMWYLYGASGNEHRNLMPNYLLQWEMIKIAIKNKCKIYDFRGVSVEKKENDGLYRFKKSFGGDFVELIGEVYMEFSPIRYKLFKIGKKIFCNLRYFVYKLENK